MTDKTNLIEFFGKGSRIYSDPKFINEAFLQKKYTLKDLHDITYRTINYWDEAGYLLTFSRKTEKGWRKFSLIELLWIKLLDEIRRLNIVLEPVVPLLFDAIRFQKNATNVQDAKLEAQIAFLLEIKSSIADKDHIRLNIYADRAEFVNLSELSKSEIVQRFESYFSISINKLFKDFLNTGEVGDLQKASILNDNEIELIEAKRKNEISEFTITLNNENILKLNCAEEGNMSDQKIEELLLSPYKEVTYKTKGGKKISF